MKTSKKILLATASGVFATVLVLTASFRACAATNSWGGNEIVGNGKIVTKSTTAANFDNVTVGGLFDVTINPGTAGNVIVTTDENILPYINVTTANNGLNVGIQSGVSLSPSQNNKVTITAQTLHNMSFGGKTIFHAANLNSDHLNLNMGGKSVGYLQGDIKNLQLSLGGNSELHVTVANDDTINLTMGGKGDVSLAGTVKSLTITTGGKATIDAKNLTADDVTISGAGDSDITVHATKTLSVNTAGRSDIKYYGNPTVNKNTVGMVTVEKVGDSTN